MMKQLDALREWWRPTSLWSVGVGSLVIGSSNPTGKLLRELKEQGLCNVVCLLDTREQPTRYDISALHGFTWVNIPILNFCAPTLKQLQDFVFVLDSFHGLTLVHCQGGIGRTGTMACAYIMYKYGLSTIEAINKIREQQPNAVETDDQIEALYAFEARNKI